MNLQLKFICWWCVWLDLNHAKQQRVTDLQEIVGIVSMLCFVMISFCLSMHDLIRVFEEFLWTPIL